MVNFYDTFKIMRKHFFISKFNVVYCSCNDFFIFTIRIVAALSTTNRYSTLEKMIKKIQIDLSINHNFSKYFSYF